VAQKNKLFYGDNLDVLRRYIKDETVDLCYIDPPFNSKRNYNQIYNNVGKEDKAQAQAFVDTWTWDTTAEEGLNEILTNYNGLFTRQTVKLITGLREVLDKGSLLAYLVSMTLRIVEIHRVLKPTGSFYLHCDPTASHYLKLILDSVFCSQGGDYINEITWKRSTAKGDAKQGAKHFGRITDIILYYVKDADNYVFNAQYEPYTDEAIARDYKYKEENTNRVYRLAPVDGPGGAAKGNPFYEFLGVKGYWRFSQEKMQKMYEEGRIVKSKTGKTLSQKMYLDESKGRQIDNFWHDINKISPTSKERLGYPTQKPELLLERIIKTSCNAGNLVLDCYCGCGTTIAVAERLNLNWIGIDITYQSISLMLKRLEDSFGKSVLSNIALNGVPQDLDSAIALANKQDDRTRKEFEKWAILTYSNNRAIINEKKGADKGIDGTAFILHTSQETREVIFSVKSGNLGVSQIRDLRGVIERENAAIGILIVLEEPTKPMLQECKQAGVYENEIMHQSFERLQIVTVREILEGKRLSLPMSLEVVKSAERKGQEIKQKSIFE
jgi:site-specific DNA-methyltransferase (adenine-specific)